MSDTPPEAIEIDAASPRPAPRPVEAPAEPEPQDTLAVSNRPDPEPKVMELGGVLWDCIDEIPAGRMADIIQDQLDLNETTESDDPMKNIKAVAKMLDIFEHFVVDQQLPALAEAMRDKSKPIGLPEAMRKGQDMLAVYFRNEAPGKP